MPRATNILYLTILPMIHADGYTFGQVQQMLTLMPDKKFATRFFPDEVASYRQMFMNRQSYFIGGHVKSYDLFEEDQPDSRIIVRVEQHVE